MNSKKPNKSAHPTAGSVSIEFGLPSPPWMAYTFNRRDCFVTPPLSCRPTAGGGAIDPAAQSPRREFRCPPSALGLSRWQPREAWLLQEIIGLAQRLLQPDDGEVHFLAVGEFVFHGQFCCWFCFCFCFGGCGVRERAGEKAEKLK
jgi:hypothetical protein